MGGFDPSLGGMGGVPMYLPEGTNDLHPDLPELGGGLGVPGMP